MKKRIFLILLGSIFSAFGMQEKKKLLFTVTNLKGGKRSIGLNGSVQFPVDRYSSGTVLGPFNVSKLRKSKQCQELIKKSQENKDSAFQDIFQKYRTKNLSCQEGYDWDQQRKCLAICLAAGANPNGKIRIFGSLLCQVVLHNDLGLALLGLECGLNPDIGTSLFSYCSLEMVQLLYLCGARITELEPACWPASDWRILQFYFKIGVRPQEKDTLISLAKKFDDHGFGRLEHFLRKLKMFLDAGIKDETGEAKEYLLRDTGIINCNIPWKRSDKQKMYGSIAVEMIKNPQIPIHYWLHKIEHRNRSREQLKKRKVVEAVKNTLFTDIKMFIQGSKQ